MADQLLSNKKKHQKTLSNLSPLRMPVNPAPRNSSLVMASLD